MGNLFSATPAVYSVPAPIPAILDFDPEKNTPESKAQSLLLSNHPSHNIVSLYGQGGVGKTTILRALAARPEIRNAFSDGIYMIELGQDAKLDLLHHRLINFVRKVCSAPFASEFQTEIVNKYTDEEAVAALVRQLSPRNFLIIFDDVWNLDARIFKLFNTISTEIQNLTDATLKLIISTRSESIAVDFHPIPVDPFSHDAEICKHMLSNYVGMEYSMIRNMCPPDREAFEFILKKCAGLPLALAVAGKAVKKKRRRGNEWLWFATDLKKSIEKLGEAGRNHPGLLSSITLSLRDMQLNWTSEAVSPQRAFQSLSVLDKQMTIPLDALARMWGTSEADACRVAEKLEENNLVTVTFEVAGEDGVGWKGLRMHDLMNDVSAHLAGESNMSDWHKCLVDVYADELGSSFDAEESIPWWNLTSPGAYMESNIVRHIVRCGGTDDALNLLTDYRWIEQMNGVKNAVPFQSVISGLRLLREDVKEGSIASDIDVMIATMIKCLVPYCLKNRRECSFQLYGRLVSLRSKSMIVERLLWSIGRYASRPWVRAGPGVLESVDGELKRVLPVGFRAEWMEWGVGRDELILGGDSGNMKCMSCIDGSVQNTFSGHERHIRGLCVDITSRFMYSCSSDGTVVQWENKEVERKFHVPLLEGEGVSCMALPEKRGVVVVGTSNGRITMVDIGSGEVMKSTKAHADWVICLTVTNGGDLLVSASDDFLIKVWDSESLEATGDALLGHTGSVWSVTVNSDDRMIASGSIDRTVRIWDVDKRREMCSPLSAHNYPIESVTFSHDGGKLCSGGWNEICVWNTCNVKDGVQFIHELNHDRMGNVYSLRLRSDDSELYALTSRGIFVWKVNGALEGSEDAKEEQYERNVTKLSMSQDEKTIVTFNKDERRFNVLRVGGVHLGSSIPVASFDVRQDISVYYFDGLSVSNNGKFVACSSKNDPIVHIFETRSGKEVFKFEELQLWWDLSYKSNSGEFTNFIDLNFDEDGISLTAQLHYEQRDEENIHSVSWDLSTGEPFDRSFHHSPVTGGSTSAVGRERNTIARLLCERDEYGYFSETVLCTSESDTFTIATLERQSESSAFSHVRNQLLFLPRRSGLQFVELILSDTKLPYCSPPPLPTISNSVQLSKNLPSPISHQVATSQNFTVFISHAGPDKKTFAHKIYAGLRKLGIRVFFDSEELHPGDEAPAKMSHAMETADIFVIILSPEFPARKWTMLELMCAFRRYDEAKKRGVPGPIIIPIFYRLSIRECGSFNLFDMTDENGVNIFSVEGLFQRLNVDGSRLTDISNAIGRLTSFTGLENDDGATNEEDEGNEGKRVEFAGRVVDAVQVAMMKIGKQSPLVGSSSMK